MNLIHSVRRQIKRSLSALGYEIRRSAPPGSTQRSVGQMHMLLADLCQRGFAPTAVLDVGANRASWSRMAKAVFPDANLFMVEPQIEMEPHLQRFCAEHPGSKYFLAGAGAISCEMSLTIWDDLAGSSLLPSVSTELQLTGRQRTVPIVTLDELVSSNQMLVPQLVKLDVQGFELEVLKGGKQLFGQVEAFILETNLYRFFPNTPLLHEVVAFMAERNYVIYDLPGYLHRPLDGALGQVDVCFARSDGMLRRSDEWM